MASPLMEAYVVIKASLDPLKRGLARAKRMVMSAVGTMQATFNKMASVIKKLALVITAYITVSVYAFAKFEEQLANVSTMLDKQSMRFLPKYAKELKKLAVVFGESTKTLSEGLYNILSASIAPAKALDVLTVAVTAAKAGMTDTATATYAITGILNAYGMAADKAGKVSDILFTTVFKGMTTFKQLAPVIGRVTAIAATSGVPLEEIGAALATITRGGISTEEAITGLRMALIALTGISEDSVRIAKEHGVELSVEALRTKGLTGMLKEVSKLSEENRKDIFKRIRARIALSVLIKDQTGYLRDYGMMMKSTGATQRAFNKMTGTLSFNVARLKQAFVILSVAVGAGFRPALITITKGLIKVTGKITVFVEKNEKSIAMWGEIIVAHMKSTVKFMIDLWKNKEIANAVKYGLDLALAEFEYWGNLLIPLMKKIGIDLANALMSPILKGFDKIIKFSTKHPAMTGISPILGAAFTGAVKGRQALAPPKLMTMEDVARQRGQVTKRLVEMPPGVKNIMEKMKQNLKDEVDLIRKKYKQIREEEKVAEQIPPGSTMVPGGGVTPTAKPSAAGQVGFVGIKEAWKQMAESLTIKKSPEVVELKKGNELNKQLVKAAAELLRETIGMRKEIKGVGTVVT